MAMTADSQSHSSQSPRGAGSGDGVNSPHSRKNLPSPWAKVVRGEPESIPALHPLTSPSSLLTSSREQQSNFSDCSPRKPLSTPLPAADNFVGPDTSDSNSANVGRPKKPAWKKPLNGAAERSSVMGADSWPALSESTKPSPKSIAADSSSKIVSDGPQGPVIPDSPHSQASSNAKSNSVSNYAMPARQKSMKRGGSGGSSSGGGYSHSSFSRSPPPPPPLPIFAMSPNGYGNLVPAIPDQSPRDASYRSNYWEPRPAGGFGPQPPVVNDHRHSSRRGNFGQRGDGPYQNNFGGRRDQDRGHYGNFRDVHGHPQRSPRGFVRPPPPNTAAFVPPQHVRPFGNHMGFSDLVYIPTMSLETFRVPFITNGPAPAMIVPVHEPPLSVMLVIQIEYYFSDANLIKDEYLKSNMDNQGWVPITLIAGFNRVKNMTKDIQLILESLMTSTLLEVQGDKVRRRNDWMKWIPSSSRIPTDSGLQSSNAPSHDLLTKSFQKMTVEEMTPNLHSRTFKPSRNPEDAVMSTTGLTFNPEDAVMSSTELAFHSQISQREGIDDASSS
ncbi:hypothetical protein P3X46_020745 [Hevea brasiliensis]|uniref:HTH La-type RNA-binding domain-containing protein n=1 Tax=Hevea brasiliensis TaxID=3981 RepID=A0ABQ9LDC0_HEVBR|nr:hypothetical protein P3X46_020745 [Hevea brasiliensis]